MKAVLLEGTFQEHGQSVTSVSGGIQNGVSVSYIKIDGHSIIDIVMPQYMFDKMKIGAKVKILAVELPRGFSMGLQVELEDGEIISIKKEFEKAISLRRNLGIFGAIALSGMFYAIFSHPNALYAGLFPIAYMWMLSGAPRKAVSIIDSEWK